MSKKVFYLILKKYNTVQDCTSHSGELRTEPQAEWLSVEGLVSETKRLADDGALPEVVGLNVRIAMEYCELGSLIERRPTIQRRQGHSYTYGHRGWYGDDSLLCAHRARYRSRFEAPAQVQYRSW